MLDKRPSELTREDIDRLFEEEISEGADIEFKEGPSARDGNPTNWLDASGKLVERSRNEALKHIVAFANAQGGHLIYGIAESRDHPPPRNTICSRPRLR